MTNNKPQHNDRPWCEGLDAEESEVASINVKLNKELGIANSKDETLAAAKKPAPAPVHAAKLAATASRSKGVVKHVAAAPRKADKAEINPLAVIEQV